MKRIFSLLTVLLCAAGSAAVLSPSDEGYCQLRFYGSFDGSSNGGMSTVHSKEDLLRSGPTFDTASYVSFARHSIDDPKYKMTFAGTNIQTKLGDTGTTGVLWLSIQHAIQVDAQGNPVKAVQKACVVTGLYSTINPSSVLFSDFTCANGINKTPDPVGFPARPHVGPIEEVDPFAPNSGWEEVKIVNGIPELKLNKTVYLETPSGSGILKAMCSAFDSSNVISVPSHA
jgi:hypothetical protein